MLRKRKTPTTLSLWWITMAHHMVGHLIFFNAKDFAKNLSNRNDALIFLGGLEFMAFSNLTMRWVKSLLVGGCLWVIRINTSKDGMTGRFPTSAHIPYANKIA
jgi:hypothetical protein